MVIILKHNLFEFEREIWTQVIGTAMGSHPAPNYANAYLAERIDKQILMLAEIFKRDKKLNLIFMKRFLDDIFKIFSGTTKEFHNFFDEMNKMHLTLKFTMNHTTLVNEPIKDKCDCEPKESIPYLDTSCSLENGKIILDLYKKETDRNQYLLPSSCHPMTCTKNIPFSLSLRIIRICTKPESRDQRLGELKDLLLDRKYSPQIIEIAIEKAKKISRKKAIKKVKQKKQNNRPVFAVKFDPRLPSIPSIQARHWRSMITQDPYLAEVFSEPPLTAFKRQTKSSRSTKEICTKTTNGLKNCRKQYCTVCPYIKEGKTIRIKENTTWEIKKNFNCENYNVIYLIECEKDRSKEYRKERESYHIRQLNTFYKGMNKQK